MKEWRKGKGLHGRGKEGIKGRKESKEGIRGRKERIK